MFEKAKWFNDYDSPVIFGIDDLSNAYYNYDSPENRNFYAKYDFGYRGLKEDSIFTYFKKFLLDKYPEIKYTVFLPFGKMSALHKSNTPYLYSIFDTKDFIDLLRYIIKSGNEIAYHGHHHGYKNASFLQPTWCKEYESFAKKDEFINLIKNDLEKFEKMFNYKIKGGRSPCFMWEDELIQPLIDLGFKWWSFHHIEKNGFISRQYKGYNIVSMPSNVEGNIFSPNFKSLKGKIKDILKKRNLKRLIKNREVISVAEHFMTSRADGIRQYLNIFDDIYSLDKLFAFFRTQKIWYATFSDVAKYFTDFHNSKIIKLDSNVFSYTNNKNKTTPEISIVSSVRKIKNLETGKFYYAHMVDGKWIFNNLKIGKYRLIDE